MRGSRRRARSSGVATFELGRELVGQEPRVSRSRMPPACPMPIATNQRISESTTQRSPNEKSWSLTSQKPSTSVSSAPKAIITTAIRVRPRKSAISLGRSLRRAATLNAAASTPPPRNRKAPRHVQREQPVGEAHGAERTLAPGWTRRERHLRLLTDTIEAVNSTLDLEEVLSLVADQGAPTRSTPTPASSTSTTSAPASSCCARRTARASRR